MGNNTSKEMISDNPQYRELRRGYEGIRSRRGQLEELTKNEDVRKLLAEGAEYVKSALSELEKHLDKDGPMKMEPERGKHRRRHAGHHRRHGRRKYSNSGALY